MPVVLVLLTLLAAGYAPAAVQPFLEQHCVACHSAQLTSGGLNLRTTLSPEVMRSVVRRLEADEMPPAGVPRPPADQIGEVTASLKAELSRLESAAPIDPGRVTARRLNRTSTTPAFAIFSASISAPPTDDFGYGFDNIGDVLTLSPALMEKYLNAAKKIASLAIDAPAKPKTPVVDHRKNLSEQWAFVWNRRFSWEGDYEIRFAVPYFVDNRHDPGTIFISIDNAEPQSYPLATEYANEGRYQDVKVHLTSGLHQLKGWAERDSAATLAEELKQRSKTGPVTKEEAEAKIAGTRQPYIESIEVHGPSNPSPAPRPGGYATIMAEGLPALARRAWRRPVTAAETVKLASFITMARRQGDSPAEAMKVGLMAILVSPNFLFRTERQLGPYELASRLSYFLWSSIPDEELLRAAERNDLSGQAARMLKDPKALSLVDNFGAQWLLVRNLDSINPDPVKFPFTGALRASMKEETRLFFEDIVEHDRSILDFLTARYTWMNEPLAKLYGIPGVTGNEFRKVDLTGTPRMGIVTQASVLTVSSYATRTSPVIRGKWILENILNAPPPPPPANVPSLEASPAGPDATLREQMEKHRENPVCASCHAKMDPLGFGLENFDAIGRWRTMDGKSPIDSKGVLPDGRSFAGPEQLLQILADDKESFTRCLTEKLLTFALGRGLEPYDRPAVDQIVRNVAAQEYRFSSLIFES